MAELRTVPRHSNVNYKQLKERHLKREMEIKYPENYKRNNPNILKRIEKDLKAEDGKIINANYLFQGPVGCGKTTLGAIIYNNIQKPGSSVRKTFNKLYDEYLMYMNSNFSDKYDAINDIYKLLTKNIVFLDDLGDEKPGTDAAHDFVSGLLTERYDHIKKCSSFLMDDCITVITTNLDGPSIIRTYGSRVYDRIQEVFVICKFNEVSFRQKQRTIIKG
jgi:DNA replication protein DnaC